MPRKSGRGNRALGGCLITVAILLLIIVAAGWWFVGRPLAKFSGSVQQIAEIQSMDRQLTNRSAFTAPANNELDASQVDRYMSVLGDIRTEMQAHLTVLEERYEQFGTEQPTLMDIPRLAGAYSDFIGLIAQARQAQINALNAHNFSAEEYGWTRREVLRAAGIQGAGYDLNTYLGALGGAGSLEGSRDSTPPPAGNVELVREYGSELNELGVIAILGL